MNNVSLNRNDGNIEQWVYTDTAKKNGVIFAFSPTAIQLYKLESGKPTPTKRFE